MSSRVGSADIVQEMWLPRSSPAPSPRTLHTEVWTGSELIIWNLGGDASANHFLDLRRSEDLAISLDLEPSYEETCRVLRIA